MPTNDAQPPLSAAEIAAMRARCEAATEGPWYYNGYSRIASGHYGDIEDGEIGVVQELPYPDGKRPGPPWLVGADQEWIDKRHAAYETDPDVAWVPAEYGDTATGRHAADAVLIEHARADLSRLLDELERARALLSDVVAPHPTGRAWERTFQRVNDYLRAVQGQPAEPERT